MLQGGPARAACGQVVDRRLEAVAGCVRASASRQVGGCGRHRALAETALADRGVTHGWTATPVFPPLPRRLERHSPSSPWGQLSRAMADTRARKCEWAGFGLSSVETVPVRAIGGMRGKSSPPRLALSRWNEMDPGGIEPPCRSRNRGVYARSGGRSTADHFGVAPTTPILFTSVPAHRRSARGDGRG
jgi:hypothetical protein